MTEPAICDAVCIIGLERIGRLDLLTAVLNACLGLAVPEVISPLELLEVEA